MNAYAVLVISILIGVGGQVSLKAGALHNPGVSLGALFCQPYVLLGLFAYFVSALLYIYALREIPLSVAFPSVSISYVLVAVLAHLIWGETLGLRQVAALVLIGSGICVLWRA